MAYSDIVFLILNVILLSATVVLIYILLQGAPFVSSRQEQVLKMLKLTNAKPGEKAADIGSGDGRIVIALAKIGVEAHGYEIDPWLIWKSRQKIKKAGLENKARIHWRNFWHEDFSSFDILTIYGIKHIMKRLENKLKKELKTGARVVSNGFKFPNWQPQQSQDNIHLYIVQK